MTNKKVTLTEVAKKAQISIASASRVIHTPHLTSWQTQSRVKKAIAELDFDAKNLFKPYAKNTQSKKILVIDNQLAPRSLINKAIEEMAQKEGYKILYLRFLYFNQNEIQQIIIYTINHQLDGIIIINNSPYVEKLSQYAQVLPPIVLVNYFSLQLACVYFDHLSIAYQATEYLLSQGHSKIAILLSDRQKISSSYLEQGYLQALTRVNNDEHCIVYDCYHYTRAMGAVKNLLLASSPPTALICADNLCLDCSDEDKINSCATEQSYLSPNSTILGVIEQCRQMQIPLATQLSLLYISHSKQLQNNQLDTITTVYKPLYHMGLQAFDLLIELIQPVRGINSVNRARLIESELLIRN